MGLMGRAAVGKQLLHVVLLVLRHTRRVREVPESKDFIKMWLETLSVWERDLVRAVGVSVIPRSADAVSEDAYQPHILLLAAPASRAQGKAGRSRVGWGRLRSWRKLGYCTGASEPQHGV